jgi:hypothetical protein
MPCKVIKNLDIFLLAHLAKSSKLFYQKKSSKADTGVSIQNSSVYHFSDKSVALEHTRYQAVDN